MSSLYNVNNIEVEFKKFLTAGNNKRARLTINNYLSDLRHYLGWLIQENVHLTNTVLNDSFNLKEFFYSWNSSSITTYTDYLKASKVPQSTINRRSSTLRTFKAFLHHSHIITETPTTTTFYNPLIDKRSETQNQGLKVLFHNLYLNFNERYKSKNIRALFLGIYLFLLIAGTALYFENFISQPGLSNGIVQGAISKRSDTTLAFESRLLDSVGNPIAAKTPVRFKIYSSSTGSNFIYDSKICYVTPDKNGNINILIGGIYKGIACGEVLPRNFLTQYSKLYLGITVGQDKEIKPRQQIENVQLASNSKKLNGYSVGTHSGAIPYIDNNGIIKLSSGSVSIESINEDSPFTIKSAKDLSLISGKQGDITFTSGENAGIHFQTNNTQGDRLFINPNGYVGISTANPTFTLDVGGSIGPSIGNIYDLGSSNKPWSTLYVRNICFVDSECAENNSTSSAELWKRNENALFATLTSNDLLIGGNATSSANVKIAGTRGSHTFIRSGYLGINTTAPVSALHVLGTGTFSSNDIDITTRENEDLKLVADRTGIVILDDTTHVSYSFASGTNVTDATTTLDISGTGTSYALCHSSQDGTDDQQIVDCVSTPTADFAEIYPVEQNSEIGDVMSIGPLLVKTKQGDNIRKLTKSNKLYDSHIIGVISANDQDFISVGHNIEKNDNPMPIALKGRIPVKIAFSSENIKAGDYITSSEQPGKATKSTRPGVVIGKALEDWDPTMGKSSIMVFINIEYAYTNDFVQNTLGSLENTLNVLGGTFEAKEKIISPVVEADVVKTNNLQTNMISAKNKDITIDISKPLASSSSSGELAKVIVKGFEGKTVTTIDNQGNIVTRGSIEASTASISGQLQAESIDSRNLITNEATISGTLKAENIESNTINELKNNIANAVEKYTIADKNIADIRNNLNTIKSLPLPNPAWYQNLDADENTSDQTLLSNLIVTGDTNLFNAHIHERIYTLQDKLKIDAGTVISFFDDNVTITRDGSLITQNKIVAKGGIQTSSIQPLSSNLDIQLNENLSQSALQVKNSHQENVASIDASGSATFKRITIPANSAGAEASGSAIIAKDQNLIQHGFDLYGIQTQGESAGVANLPENESEVVIFNTSLTKDSLIFLTPIDTINSPLYISNKQTCESSLSEYNKQCIAYVKVATSQKEHPAIRFNWLILNNK